MSEADSSNNESGLPAAMQPVDEPTPSAGTDAATASGGQAGDDGWQTIAFPGAISIDAIPQAQAAPSDSNELEPSRRPGVIHYSDASISPTAANFGASTAEPAATTTLIEQLQQENALLRDRLSQLEHDLIQHQIESQLEATRTLTNSVASVAAAELASPAADAGSAQARLEQLFQELELSHQATQRQQILVETLTEQLSSSQERIAHLERDCALTQQRYNEQVQQVLQVENTCRDLRMRLHRQQQQTLQFKAALEKCLEMPSPYSHSQVLLEFNAADEATDELPATSDLLKPKNQPVKPWSVSTTQSAIGGGAERQTEFFKSAFMQSEQPAAPEQTSPVSDAGTAPWSVVGSADVTAGEHSALDAIAAGGNEPGPLNPDDPQFVTDLMQLIFPDVAQPSIDAMTASLEGGAIFDLGPFLGAERAAADSLSSPDNLVIDTADAAADGRVADPLWADLANLIDPLRHLEKGESARSVTSGEGTVDCPASEEPASEATAIEPASIAAMPLSTAQSSSSAVARSTQPSAILPLFATAASVDHNADSVDATAADSTVTSTRSQPVTWTWRDRLVPLKQTAPAGESESDRPGSDRVLEMVSAGKPLATEPATTPSSVSFATKTPSPIVYPLRSTKKLASLAAVDLPTFPKR